MNLEIEFGNKNTVILNYQIYYQLKIKQKNLNLFMNKKEKKIKTQYLNLHFKNSRKIFN